MNIKEIEQTLRNCLAEYGMNTIEAKMTLKDGYKLSIKLEKLDEKDEE